MLSSVAATLDFTPKLFESNTTIESDQDLKEYGSEIYQYMTQLETDSCPHSSFMDSQTEITWKMRKTLLLWLVEVHVEYRLQPETLHLAINIIDRLCSRVKISRHQYQLLGISSLWLAAKFEENHGKVPALKNLAFVCCHSYLEKDFVAMERLILRELGFGLGVPTLESFLKIHCAFYLNGSVCPITMNIARYIMDISTIHRRFIGLAPSLVSLAAVLLADEITGSRQWYYEHPQLVRTIENLAECLTDTPRQLLKKYSHEKYTQTPSRVQCWIDSRFSVETSSMPPLTPPKELSPWIHPSQVLTPTSPNHPGFPVYPSYPYNAIPLRRGSVSTISSSSFNSLSLDKEENAILPFWDLHLMPLGQASQNPYYSSSTDKPAFWP